MGLYTDKAHILGRDQKFFVEEEVTPGTFVVATATGGANVIKSSFSPKINRKDRIDSYLASRDVIERITGKSEHSWELEAFLVPSGSLTTPTKPDLASFFKSLFGTETDTPATSVAFSQSAGQTKTLLSLTRHFNSLYQESMWGAWVDSMTINANGGDEPKVKFQGGAMGYGSTGYGVTGAGLSGSEVAVVVTAANIRNFEVGSVIQVGTSVGAGSVGHKVTAVDTATYTLTITPAIVGAQNSGVAVIPYVPTHTDTGSPITGITGSLSLDAWTANSIPVTSFELTYNDGLKPFRDEAYVQNVSDVLGGMRSITGKIGMRFRQDAIVHYLKRSAFAAHTLSVILGTGTATKFTIAMSYLELEYVPVEIPEADEGALNFNFKALGSSGNDAITLTMT